MPKKGISKKGSRKPKRVLSPFMDLWDETTFKYKALFDSNMIGIARTDFNDAILDANEAFLSIVGYTREDFKKKPLTWSMISPRKYDKVDLEKMDELLKNQRIVPFEKEYIHKDGHTVPVLVGAEAADNTLSKGVSFALDISEIKELERKKDDFIGIVSHELKTPLTIMKLYADFLRTSIEDGKSKEELLESANEVINQMDKLNILITDLLNMARYHGTESTFPMSAVNVGRCFKKVVSDLSRIQGRKIAFICEDAIYVTGNQDRLSQVAMNLISNAIRYSNGTSKVVVRVAKNKGQACISVQDYGMGIDKENIDRIFERYYRINHADDYAQKGAGIGLYICREIIKYHGGNILVKSTLGKGSTFTIELPLLS